MWNKVFHKSMDNKERCDATGLVIFHSEATT